MIKVKSKFHLLNGELDCKICWKKSSNIELLHTIVTLCIQYKDTYKDFATNKELLEVIETLMNKIEESEKNE